MFLFQLFIDMASYLTETMCMVWFERLVESKVWMLNDRLFEKQKKKLSMAEIFYKFLVDLVD